MPLIKSSSYSSPFFLRNGHVGTLYPSLFRKVEGVKYNRERIPTPDDDFLDLDWSTGDNNQKCVIVSHGLEGSSSRPYVQGMVKLFGDQGWDAVGWNCRSCSGEINLQPILYHHGATQDIRLVVDHVVSRGYSQVAMIGFSMGGSMTIKYLGENDILEREPFEKLSKDKEIAAFKFDGFWECMDTFKDVQILNKLWKNNEAPWKK